MSIRPARNGYNNGKRREHTVSWGQLCRTVCVPNRHWCVGNQPSMEFGNSASQCRASLFLSVHHGCTTCYLVKERLEEISASQWTRRPFVHPTLLPTKRYCCPTVVISLLVWGALRRWKKPRVSPATESSVGWLAATSHEACSGARRLSAFFPRNIDRITDKKERNNAAIVGTTEGKNTTHECTQNLNESCQQHLTWDRCVAVGYRPFSTKWVIC